MYRSKFRSVGAPVVGALGVFVWMCALGATAEAFDTLTEKPPAAAQPQEVEQSLEPKVGPAVTPVKVLRPAEPTRSAMGGEPCGNSICEMGLGETCVTCPADCGECSCDGDYPDDCDDAQIGIQGSFLHEFPIDDCWDLDGSGECDPGTGDPCTENADCTAGTFCEVDIDGLGTCDGTETPCSENDDCPGTDCVNFEDHCSGPEDADDDLVCDDTDCSWAGLAFPIIVEGISVDTVRVSLNSNRSGGDIYITGSAFDDDGVCQPNVLDLRRELGCALSGLATNVEHALHFESLITTPFETLWVVMRGRSGLSGSDGLDSDGDGFGFYDGSTFPAHAVGRSAIIPSQPNNSFANLAGTGNVGDWTDLNDLAGGDGLPLGTFYCVDLTAEFEDEDTYCDDDSEDPKGACCFGFPVSKDKCGPCPTDVDGSGDTVAFDLAFLLGNWGEIPKDADPAVVCLDADGDGNIGAFDLAVLLGAWGPCAGCAVMRGFECGALGGAYLGDGTTCFDCDQACNDGAGDCCIANGTAGCDTSDCCHYVCGLDAFCCGADEGDWDSSCAQQANDTVIGCGQLGEVCEPTQCVEATTESIPECIQTGTDSGSNGFLGIVADEYGAHASWADFGGGNSECEFGDLFNPAAFDALEATFGCALFWYKPDTSQRVVLSDVPNHEDTYPVDFSGFSEIPEGGANVASDQFGDDGLNDTLNSAFNVCGPNDVSLAFTLEQTVEQVSSTVAVWTQVYNITNISGTAIDFQLARQDDYDMVWVNGAADDSVGTMTNKGDPGGDRSVYQMEDGRPSTAVTLSSPQGTTYWGGKGDVDPDGDGGPGPPYGCGTDFQQWDAYGVPGGWANHIANVGYDTDGESGSSIPGGCGGGCSCDGSIGMTIEISLDPDETTCVCIQHTYGQRTPWAGGTCPEGCN